MACSEYYFTQFSIIVISLIILKIVIKLSITWNKSPTCLVGKTAIVTGANTGIGFFIAQDFAKRGARVILACRNREKAEKAGEKIITATGNKNIAVKIVDLASLKSVREFVKDVYLTEDRLDILVNNAGVFDVDKRFTSDGLVHLLQVNYFGPFLLTNLLIDLLKKSVPSRIVFVESYAFIFAKLDENNINSHTPMRTYINAKYLTLVFSCELARRLKGTGVVSNYLHPGIVYTEFFRTVPGFVKPLVKIIIFALFRTAEEGAQTAIYVAVAKDLENVSGKYFDNCRIALLPTIPKKISDTTFTKNIWEQSEALVKLTVKEQRL